MSLYSAIARPLLFRLAPETAHELTLEMLALAARVCGRWAGAPSGERREVFGLSFPNAVGLAAGMDKNASALPAWPLLGFGHAEIGTVTALPQPGNPKPRLFRFPAQRALINRMGFNNEGAEAVARRLSRWRHAGLWPRVPVGINLGKSKVTPLEEAAADYAASFRHLRDFGDYFVVNVSSPNTPGLRDLQAAGHLRQILLALARENEAGKPVLVKIAPDLSDDDIRDVVAAGEEAGASGWVATNTTLDHSSVPPGRDQQGGLSGEPLRARATQVVRLVSRLAGRPVVGVGGIASAADAAEKLSAGASLVQIYTGLVYAGPELPRLIERGIAAAKPVSGAARRG